MQLTSLFVCCLINTFPCISLGKTTMASPLALHGIPNLQSLPPGCKYLNCEEAHSVLRSCATWRLPNGSVLAPFGGEIYQVIELPSECGDRCSLKQVSSLKRVGPICWYTRHYSIRLSVICSITILDWRDNRDSYMPYCQLCQNDYQRLCQNGNLRAVSLKRKNRFFQVIWDERFEDALADLVFMTTVLIYFPNPNTSW